VASTEVEKGGGRDSACVGGEGQKGGEPNPDEIGSKESGRQASPQKTFHELGAEGRGTRKPGPSTSGGYYDLYLPLRRGGTRQGGLNSTRIAEKETSKALARFYHDRVGEGENQLERLSGKNEGGGVLGKNKNSPQVAHE